GQAQDTYTLTPVGFSGGQDEIISQIPQITMGSGQNYEDFEFTQVNMSSKIIGVVHQTESLSTATFTDGINEDFFNFGTVELTGGNQEAYAQHVMNGSGFPVGFHWQGIFKIKDSNGIVIVNYPSADTERSLNSVVTIMNAYNDANQNIYPFTIIKTEQPMLLTSTMNNPGVAYNQNYSYLIDYTSVIDSSIHTDAPLIGTFAGGQNEIAASADVIIDKIHSKLGSDKSLNIDNKGFSISSNNLEETSQLEIAQIIMDKVNENSRSGNDVKSVEVTMDSSDVSNPVLTFTSIDNTPWNTRDLDISNSDYTSITPEKAKFSISITGDLVESAQDSILEIDGEQINLGIFSQTPTQILNQLNSKTFTNYEDYSETGNLLLIFRDNGVLPNGENPLDDSIYTTVNGVSAQAEFTITQPIDASAQDTSIKVLGVDVTLGTTGDTVNDIATDIMNFVNTANIGYTVSTGGTATVTITKNDYSVDTTPIFGSGSSDMDYTTQNGIAAQSNVIIIPSAIQTTSQDDLSVLIAGKTITFTHGDTLADIGQAIDAAFDPNSDMYDVVLSNANTEIQFVATSYGVNNNNLIVGNDDGKYNSKDNKAASLEYTLPSTLEMPANANENILIIDGHTFNLGTSMLDVDGIGNAIADADDENGDNNFNNLLVNYDDSTDKLTFTTVDENANTDNFSLGADLTFVTKNKMWASSTFQIQNGYSGTSFNNLVSTDNTILIGTVTIDFGTTQLNETGVATAIKTALDADSTFSGIYTVTSTNDVVNIEKNTPIADTTELNNGNSPNNMYTSVNEIKSTGSLQLTQAIVNAAMDKEVIISSKSITFDNSGEDISSMAQTIVDELSSNTNVVATTTNTAGEVLFSSKLYDTSGNGDIVTNFQYNGRAQSSTLEMLDLEAGYTYELSINGQTHSNIVTPQTNLENIYQMIFDKIDLDSDLTTSLASNSIGVQGPVQHVFGFTLTGASNTAPTTTVPTISGNTVSGQTLTCDYTYSDTESNTELNTNIEWFSDGQSIQSSTSNMYTLTDYEKNKLITCKVTPGADYGVTPGMMETSEEVLIAYDVLTLSNNDLFSVPYGVDYQRMLSEVPNLVMGDDIKEYDGGIWVSLGSNPVNNILKPLYGYKFVTQDTNKVISLPIYIDNEYPIQNVFRELDSNFNLVGLNSITQRNTSDFLHNFNHFNAIYDENNNLVFTGLGTAVLLNPTKAYWMSVSGVAGETKIFYGVPSGLN
ncbi:MAG: hypothetical protein HRU03_08740, partial [Nanoarchaeales archaeon]|nr:hypothetical protein [Nanoarchaeales archaeon]